MRTIVLGTLLVFQLSAAGASGPAAQYIGSTRCGQCHQSEHQAWRGSHHDLAMAEADGQTVLGDFEDQEITAQGVTSRFFRKDGGYYVRTDGPDGVLQDYRVRYTFGWYPLQQYLVEFSGGRLQSLSLAWDSRPKAEGGQRWFHLYKDEVIDHTHELHWTGREQTWNYQCAECHSTNLQKGYDSATDSYATTWSEIDVACEACHGPGRRHQDWAEGLSSGKSKPEDADKGLALDLKDRDGGLWTIDENSGKPSRSKPRMQQGEIEMCARCHSRRGQIWSDYEVGRPLLDTHRPAILNEHLYYPDGQIKEEVYVYGSFLQSRMYAAGVICTDCHEPHSLRLRAEGNAVCARCHLSSRYDTTSHHHHPLGSEGAACAACHMPQRTYMVVDDRADHSLRVPRPDLSASLGTPNACNGCHADRSPGWASNAVADWYPDSIHRGRHFGQALQGARSGDPGAGAALLSILTDPDQPSIVKATVLEQLNLMPREEYLQVIKVLLADPDPLVRMAALGFLEHADITTRVDLGWVLLDDPVRAVRLDAALMLAPLIRQRLPEKFRAQLQQRIEEYETSQRVNAERPESHLNLGLIATAQGRVRRAEAAYRSALRIDPRFAPAYINLADLYRQAGQDAKGEQVLLEGIDIAPREPALYQAIGLLYVRQNKLDKALQELKRAAELAPDQGRYAFVYALALDKANDKKQAAEILETLLLRNPAYTDAALTLVNIYREQGDTDRARRRLEALRERSPEDPRVRSLEQQLAPSEVR